MIDDYMAEIGGNDLPLTLHFAELYIDGDRDNEVPQVFLKSNALGVRYGTRRFLPGNNFYKPISRTLNV